MKPQPLSFLFFTMPLILTQTFLLYPRLLSRKPSAKLLGPFKPLDGDTAHDVWTPDGEKHE
jgi:hypothetical protein